jgi:hypothetical protein
VAATIGTTMSEAIDDVRRITAILDLAVRWDTYRHPHAFTRRATNTTRSRPAKSGSCQPTTGEATSSRCPASRPTRSTSSSPTGRTGSERGINRRMIDLATTGTYAVVMVAVVVC